MPESRRYRTSLGSWGVWILLGQTGVVLATVGFWRVGAWPMVVLAGIVLCLGAWILFGTRYVIGGGVLDARRGPFRMQLPLRDITAVQRHAVDRGVMFGFGPDFIGIEYGANAINVSPRDADGFIRALEAAMPVRAPPRTIGAHRTPRIEGIRSPSRLPTLPHRMRRRDHTRS